MTEDMVNHPPHYTGTKINGIEVECIDAIEALGLGYHLGNAFKYLWRAGKKGDVVEDLRKAVWYLNRELEKNVNGS